MISSFGITDRGMLRRENQDACAYQSVGERLAWGVVCDGMGGARAGDIASRIGVEVFREHMEKYCSEAEPTTEVGHELLAAVEEGNEAILFVANRNREYYGMGTTLVTGLFHDNRLTVAHIGDSRLYRLRDEKLTPITHDHSLLQEQIDQGMISAKDARFSQNKNLVTRALGVEPTVESEIHEYEVLPGDVYLLCSDGLNDMLPDEEIELALQSLTANLELAADHLIQAANDNGGRDNVSVILVKVLRVFPEHPGDA